MTVGFKLNSMNLIFATVENDIMKRKTKYTRMKDFWMRNLELMREVIMIAERRWFQEVGLSSPKL